jgi:uncharacterized protein (DUF2267 family)
MATTSAGLTDDQTRASFVRDIAARAELPPYATAEWAAAEVMCALTERLTPGGAHRLLEALPPSLRPLFERCAERQRGPARKFDRAELLARIGDHLGVTPRHAERICQSVAAAIRSCVSADVAERVGMQLPADLQELWFAPSLPIVSQAAAADELEEARREILAEIERSGALPPGTDSAEALMAVMCIFSRRLSGGEARNLWLALPNTLRPLVGACTLHRPQPAAVFGEGEFVARVAEHLATAPDVATRLIQAVFAIIRRWISEKDVADVASQLPVDLRSLWAPRSSQS